MTASYAYFMPAIAQGFDRDEGLEFSFFYGGEPGATAHSLCEGACDIACLNTIVGFMGRSNGLPMVAVGSKARRAHRYFAVLPESPIRRLADLKGKKIACDFPHIQPLAEAALAAEGVEPGSFAWMPWHGSGMKITDMIAPLRSGEEDALFIMDWTDGDARAQGLELRHIRSRLLEHIRVSSCYWTTENKLAAEKDILTKALRAIQKSLVFSFADPEASLRAMWDIFPQTRPSAAGREETFRHDLEVLKACLEPMRIDSADPDSRWCAIPSAEMSAWQEFLLKSNIIPRELDLTKLYTTSLVPGLNDFDAKQIRQTTTQQHR
jgi:NitT/TauT family transport system substrate-binding protein